jgi:hypothetical protein
MQVEVVDGGSLIQPANGVSSLLLHYQVRRHLNMQGYRDSLRIFAHLRLDTVNRRSRSRLRASKHSMLLPQLDKAEEEVARFQLGCLKAIRWFQGVNHCVNYKPEG